jgi:hypothetical protein
MTLPCERTRAVLNVREFLYRLSTPYIANGIKRIPAAVRDEARRLLRHYPNVVDLKYAKESFCPDEADRAMNEGDETERGGWRSIADGEPPMSRVLAAREVNGRRYVDVVSWITEPDSGLPRLSPTLSQITHWMPLPEPPEVT